MKRIFYQKVLHFEDVSDIIGVINKESVFTWPVVGLSDGAGANTLNVRVLYLDF